MYVCFILLGANHMHWGVFFNKCAIFHDLNSHMRILRHQYLFQMLSRCIYDIWERFCVAKINIVHFTSKNSSTRFSFFAIHFYIQFWLVTKVWQVSCGELFVSYLLSIDLSNEAKFMLPPGVGTNPNDTGHAIQPIGLSLVLLHIALNVFCGRV